MEDMQFLMNIYDEIHGCLKSENKDWTKLRNILEGYKNSQNVSILKTLLVITKGFQNHPEISDVRLEIKKSLTNILGPLV